PSCTKQDAARCSGQPSYLSSPMAAICFSPNGQHLVVGTLDGSTVTFRTKDGEREHVRTGNQQLTSVVAFPDDGKWFLAGATATTYTCGLLDKTKSPPIYSSPTGCLLVL